MSAEIDEGLLRDCEHRLVIARALLILAHHDLQDHPNQEHRNLVAIRHYLKTNRIRQHDIEWAKTKLEEQSR